MGIFFKPRPAKPSPEAAIRDLEDKSAALSEQVCQLDADKASRDDVQAVWEQMAAAYSEGVQTA